MQWRKWNVIIHRDLGYLCAGLTLVYAASGVAVNHRADWNPNYSITRETVLLGTTGRDGTASPLFVDAVLAELDLTGPVRGTFRPDPGSVDIFLEGATVSVDLNTGEATWETVRARPLLRAANFLHLNEPKGVWTWMADLYASALALLAVTGLFVVKGSKGITGRGAWLTAMGVLIPVAFVLAYR
ncbi:MAG: PepSY-associated TM helix domain-containing protein [Gemmatimonadota bacterium]|nr:PepSY-associated TM helix domain-containing protein [Gemmatimonadota bacterium]